MIYEIIWGLKTEEEKDCLMGIGENQPSSLKGEESRNASTAIKDVQEV